MVVRLSAIAVAVHTSNFSLRSCAQLTDGSRHIDTTCSRPVDETRRDIASTVLPYQYCNNTPATSISQLKPCDTCLKGAHIRPDLVIRPVVPVVCFQRVAFRIVCAPLFLFSRFLHCVYLIFARPYACSCPPCSWVWTRKLVLLVEAACYLWFRANIICASLTIR